jgi:hypothetical protein
VVIIENITDGFVEIEKALFKWKIINRRFLRDFS